jgi:hypothetical protein
MRKAFVFDFDDTLAVTDCMVIVRLNSDDTVIQRITPQEFNTHKLQPECHYDFSEFQDESFIHSANATELIGLAQQVFYEGHDVFILTARTIHAFDAINVWLLSYDVNARYVHCVGGDNVSIPENKKAVLLDIIMEYDKIYFYDDSKENVDFFQHEKLKSFLV